MAARKTYDCEHCGKPHPIGLSCDTRCEKLLQRIAALKVSLAEAVKPDAPSKFPNGHLLDWKKGNPVLIDFRRSWGSCMRPEEAAIRRDFILTIQDGTSRCLIGEIRMTPVEFLRCFIQTDGSVPAMAGWLGLSTIGTEHQRKTEDVRISPEDEATCPHNTLDPETRKETRDWALGVIEKQGLLKDGWRPQIRDMFNGHCRKSFVPGLWIQRVGFSRYVDPETGEPI